MLRILLSRMTGTYFGEVRLSRDKMHLRKRVYCVPKDKVEYCEMTFFEYCERAKI